jgi:hypothetical protein
MAARVVALIEHPAEDEGPRPRSKRAKNQASLL